jgi:predicted aldo/keto reductase-like oxidoreductase
MLYRTLGRTGLRVSALGFGAMRLPMADERVDEEESIPVVRRALDLGVNYIDSAFGYCNGTSEVCVGKAIKGYPRESLVISTKQPVHSTEDVAIWRERLETQLGRLDTPYIDVYNCHGLKWEDYEALVLGPGGVLEQARRAQAEGLIRHLCLSCHDSPENMIRLIDTGELDVLTLQYNLLDRKNAEVIAHAHEKGVGIVVMGPVGGGRLSMAPDVIGERLAGDYTIKSTPEIALRFVLTNPGVAVALSGMNTIPMVEENVAIASREEPLSLAELRQIDEAFDEIKKLADLYCTGCDYCLPCPNEVKISENFRLMNYFRLYGLEEYAKRSYGWLLKRGGAADECLECGECEPKCPQNLPIIQQLYEVRTTLGAS